MPTQPAIALDYAKSPSRRLLRRTFRIILLVTVIITAATSTRWAPPAWHRAQLVYYQRQCLNYTAPPDQIVFECDNVFVNIASQPNPICFAKLQQLLPPAVRRNSNFPVGVPVLLITPGHTFITANDRLSFLHQRRSRSGTTRLVVVGNLFGSIDYDTCVPTGVFGKSPNVQGECILFGMRPKLLDPHDTEGDGIADNLFHIRVYAGQPDSADESHFTIRYEINNKNDIIDGYLQDDGSVTLACRAGDSTRPFNVINNSAFNIPLSEDTTSREHPKIIPPRLAPGDLIDDKPRQH